MYLEPHDYWIYYVNIGLRHQYGISVAESQTFLRAKRPHRRRARRNGCFRRLKVLKTSFLGSLSSGALGVLHNCAWCGELEHITYCYVIGKFLRPITRKQQYYDFNVPHYVCVICFSTKFCIAFVFVSLKVTIISLKSNRKQHLSIVLRGKQSASCGT